MADRFDVVAIRIEDKGPKVDLMVLGAKTGTTVVAPDCRYGRLVESPHCRTVVGDLTSHGLSDRTDTYRIKYPSSDLLGEPARTLHAKFANAPSRPRREVWVGAVVAATRKDPGERRCSVAWFRRLQSPAY
jgi:hypothetical protein